MPAAAVEVLDEPARVHLALSPARRDLLERLREPSSATRLAAELGLGRQRVNYHLRALEAAGLVHLVEERQRRGFVERVLVATAERFLVDPRVMADDRPGEPATPEAQDRFANDHLLDTAATLVRDVSRQRARADERGQRLLTFTVEADVDVATPEDLERLSDDLAVFLAGWSGTDQASGGGRAYRVVVAAHPTPRPTDPTEERP